MSYELKVTSKDQIKASKLIAYKSEQIIHADPNVLFLL
jgi:hypothetical protein